MGDQDDDQKVLKVFHQLLGIMERGLRLPTGFFAGLAQRTDWEMVIKSAIVAEIALGEAIHRAVRNEERIWLDIRPGPGLGSKIRIASERGLLKDRHLNHLREIAKMQTICAHSKSGLGFTFRSYLSKAANWRSFTRDLGPLMDESEVESAPFSMDRFRTPSTALLGCLCQACMSLLLDGRETSIH